MPRQEALQRGVVMFIRDAWARLRIWLGYVPNEEWLRVQLCRALAVDRAKAHLAITELERSLRTSRTRASRADFR